MSGKQKGKKQLVIESSKPIVVKNNQAKKQKKSKGGQTFRMSTCALKYSRALMDIFNAPAGACIPTIPAIGSVKARTFARGSFQQGTSVGYVLIDPFRMIQNDSYSGTKTGTTYAGTTLVTATPTTGLTTVTAQSSYSSASFATAKGKVKLVACGLRARYSSAAMYRSGTFYVGQSPTHVTLEGQSLSYLNGIAQFIKTPIRDEWVNCFYTPTDPADFDEYIPGTSNPVASPILVIAVEGVNASGNNIDFECFADFELYGQGLPPVSPGESDIIGMSAVSNMIAHLKQYAWIGSKLPIGRIWNGLQSGLSMMTGLQDIVHTSMQRGSGLMIEEVD